MPGNRKPNMIIDANNKIHLLLGDFTRGKFHKITAVLMDKKIALISLGAGVLAGIILALLK
ncbi:hypothetical protein [Syntrophomonas curvata]